MTNPTPLVLRLAMLMHRAGISAKKLADVSGVSANHVKRIVDGRTRNPSPEMLAKIATPLGVDAQALSDGGAPACDIEAVPCDIADIATLIPHEIRGAFDFRGAEFHVLAARLIEPTPLIGGRAGDLAVIARGGTPVCGDLIAIAKEPGLIGFRLLAPPWLMALTRSGMPFAEPMDHANRPIGKLAGLYRVFPDARQPVP